MDGDKAITISFKEYLALRKESSFMVRLEVNGVDNWDWYYTSLEQHEAEWDAEEEQIRNDYIQE